MSSRDAQASEYTSTAAIIIIPVIIVLVYTAFLVIYRLYFHPLRAYPGSKLAAATKWYEFYYDILHGQGGAFMHQVDYMHDIYGPIVRINPDELHIRDPSFYQTLYGGPGSVRDKYPPAANMAGTGCGTFGTVKHDTHRMRRSAITSLYSTRTVSIWQALIRKHLNTLCDVLESSCARDGTAEIRTIYLAYSTDVICEYSFGAPWNLLHDMDRAIEWKNTLAALAFFTPWAKQMPFLIPTAKKLGPRIVGWLSPALGRLVGLFLETETRARKAVKENSERLVAGEKAQANEVVRTRPPTIFEEILLSKLPLEERSLQRMQEEGVIVISAGSETLARTMVCATFHVLEDPDSLSALKYELAEVMPNPRDIVDFEVLQRLPFLTTVIKESLRLAGITVSRLPIVSPTQTHRYGEWNILPGTPIAMTPHKTMMDPSIFPGPRTFRPQRWLVSKEEVRVLNQAYVPFGRGNRQCLGMNLAYAELYLALATLFRRYDMELVGANRARDIDPVRDCFVGEPSLESPGVRISIKRVSDEPPTQRSNPLHAPQG